MEERDFAKKKGRKIRETLFKMLNYLQFDEFFDKQKKIDGGKNREFLFTMLTSLQFDVFFLTKNLKFNQNLLGHLVKKAGKFVKLCLQC